MPGSRIKNHADRQKSRALARRTSFDTAVGAMVFFGRSRPIMAKIYSDITATIGNTPLVRLNRTAAAHQAGAEVLLKLEFFNPLSSVKDRIGVSMIEEALQNGRLKPGGTIGERMSGLHRISLVLCAATHDYSLNHSVWDDIALSLCVSVPDTSSPKGPTPSSGA